jgi:hypothetical protein
LESRIATVKENIMRCIHCKRLFINGLDDQIKCEGCGRDLELEEPDDGYSHAIAGVDPSEPHPIWVASAARQLHYPCKVSTAQTSKSNAIIVRVPIDHQDQIFERARLLADRESQGLPTEPLPSGRWPEDENEFGLEIKMNVGVDLDDKLIVIDFNQRISSVGIHPSLARYLANLMLTRANEIDPDGKAGMVDTRFLGVAKVKVDDGNFKESSINLTNMLEKGEMDGFEEIDRAESP